jgi:hypothetical protein
MTGIRPSAVRGTTIQGIALTPAVVTASETAVVVAEMLAPEMLRERPGQMGGGHAAPARWCVAWWIGLRRSVQAIERLQSFLARTARAPAAHGGGAGLLHGASAST